MYERKYKRKYGGKSYEGIYKYNVVGFLKKRYERVYKGNVYGLFDGDDSV